MCFPSDPEDGVHDVGIRDQDTGERNDSRESGFSEHHDVKTLVSEQASLRIGRRSQKKCGMEWEAQKES